MHLAHIYIPFYAIFKYNYIRELVLALSLLLNIHRFMGFIYKMCVRTDLIVNAKIHGKIFIKQVFDVETVFLRSAVFLGIYMPFLQLV